MTVLLTTPVLGAELRTANSPNGDIAPVGPYEDAPVETSFDAEDAEVIYYANRHGVPTSRAIDIANWLDQAQPLLTALPTLTDTYADARLVHGGADSEAGLAAGEIRLAVMVKDPSSSVLRDLLDDLESLTVGAFSVDVSVAEVPRSLAELEAQAEVELRDTSAPMTVEYDFEKGTVILSPAPPGSSEFDGDVWASSCADVSGGQLDGGRRIQMDDPDYAGCQRISGCTSGFPMQLAYQKGVVTAGHCAEFLYPADSYGFVTNASDRDMDMYWVYQPNDIIASAYAWWYDGPVAGLNDDDVAFLRRTSSSATYPGQIWKWDTSEWRHITGYEADHALVGQTVCEAASPAAENGASTYCGMVVDWDTNYLGQNTGYKRWTKVDFTQGDYHQGKSGGHGGSGGPMFYGGFVYGIYSTAPYDCPGDGTGSCTPAMFYRIDAMKQAMKAIISDVGFICYNSTICAPS